MQSAMGSENVRGLVNMDITHGTVMGNSKGCLDKTILSFYFE